MRLHKDILLCVCVVLAGCHPFLLQSKIDFMSLWVTESATSDGLLFLGCPLRLGYCPRFYVSNASWIHNGERSEAASRGHDLPGSEYAYSWDFFIPEDYSDEPFMRWQIIGQWHDQPDKNKGEVWATYPAHQPVMALRYGINESGLPSVGMHYGLTSDGGKVVTKMYPVSKGRWNNIKVKVFWSQGVDGYFEAKLNGQIMSSPSGTSGRFYGRNMYNAAPVYFKIGLYRDSQISSDSYLFYDNILRELVDGSDN